jgi:hypothetical protein
MIAETRDTPELIVNERTSERGAALAMCILFMAILGAVAMSVLAVVNNESRIAGSDLQRTQAFYAGAAGIEKMTTDFSVLFSRVSRPTSAQLATIASTPPPELVSEGFTLSQTIELDTAELASMRASQGIGNSAYPQVNIPSGPFAGMSASVAPWELNTTATGRTGAQISLTRKMNNYLIPIFQFGMFSDEDLEVHPGPDFTFNGRVHANGNLYLSGSMKFLDKVTTANEIVRDVLRNGKEHDANVNVQVSPLFVVPLTKGSVNSGPNFTGATSGDRGYFPGSPNGTSNGTWTSTSTSAPQLLVPNQFGGQVQTRTTGITPLLLPMQLDGNATREIIKRRMPNDSQTLSESRYHSKAEVRILIDNETGTDASGIPSGRGVLLSQFNPIILPTGASTGRALWRVTDAGAYTDTNSTGVKQGTSGGSIAATVRGVKTAQATASNGVKIPGGAGLTGRILIEIVKADGTAYDVTTQILSMGMTVGEPNAIVNLQRPLWAAFLQGSRDSGDDDQDLDFVLGKYWGADGQIKTTGGVPTQDGELGFLKDVQDDASGQQVRADSPASAGNWNSIVPISMYNVREGRIHTGLAEDAVYERGMMTVVDINMRNLARWLDGVYDGNLLAATNAVSANIDGTEGYIVYVSDRRGDRIKSERDASGATLSTTNGMVDNEDVYGPNSVLDGGEDVIDALADGAGVSKKGTLQRDTAELPDPAVLGGSYGSDKTARAKTASAWANPSNYFRRGVRLFNAENMVLTGGANKLSSTKGITVSTENMLYVWGNYNTTGINCQPLGGATLNDSTQLCYYLGSQVPASLVADALFALSKTWFDASSSINPGELKKRPADYKASISQETSVRAAVIAGNNLSSLAGSPDAGNSADGESRLNGGMHNFPRFLEDWGDSQRWNFVGSLIPLYHSTQALGPYNAQSSIYSPPLRNWAFDTTYRDPNRLPPGTPQFQYIEPSAFRQVF